MEKENTKEQLYNTLDKILGDPDMLSRFLRSDKKNYPEVRTQLRQKGLKQEERHALLKTLCSQTAQYWEGAKSKAAIHTTGGKGASNTCNLLRDAASSLQNECAVVGVNDGTKLAMTVRPFIQLDKENPDQQVGTIQATVAFQNKLGSIENSKILEVCCVPQGGYIFVNKSNKIKMKGNNLKDYDEDRSDAPSNSEQLYRDNKQLKKKILETTNEYKVLDTRYTGVVDDYKRLENKNKQLQRNYDGIVLERNNLFDENKRLKSQYSNDKNYYAQLDNELNDKNKNLKELGSEIKRLRKENDSLQQELNNAKDRDNEFINKYNKDTSGYISVLNQKKSEFEDLKHKYRQLEDKHKKTAFERDNLRDKIEKDGDELLNNNVKILDLNKKISALEGENDSLRQQLKVANDRGDNFEGQYESTANDYERLKSNYNNIVLERNNLFDENKRLKSQYNDVNISEYKRYKNFYETTNTKLLQNDIDLKNRNDQYDRLENKYNDLKYKYEQLEINYNNTMKEKNDLLTNIKKDTKAHKSEILDKNINIEVLKEDLNKLTKKNNSLQLALDSANGEKDKLEKKYKNTANDYKRLQSDFKLLNDEHNKTVNEKNNLLNEIENNKNNHSSELTNKDVEIIRLRGDIKTLEGENGSLRQQLKDASDRGNNFKNQYENTANDYKRLDNVHKQLTDSHEQLKIDYDNVEQELKTLKLENKRFEEDADEREKHYKDQLDKKIIEVNEYTKILEDYKVRNSSLEKEISNLKQQVEDKQSENKRLVDSQKKYEESHNKTIIEYKELIVGEQNRYNGLSAKHNDLNTRYSGLAQTMRDLEVKLKKSQSDNEDLKQQNNTANISISTYKRLYENQQKNNEELRTKINDAEQRHKLAIRQTEQEKRALEDKTSSLEKEVNLLNKKMKKDADDLKNEQEKSTKLKLLADRSDTTIKELKNQNTNLQLKFEKLEKDFRQEQDEHNKLKEAHKQLEAENKSLPNKIKQEIERSHSELRKKNLSPQNKVIDLMIDKEPSRIKYTKCVSPENNNNFKIEARPDEKKNLEKKVKKLSIENELLKKDNKVLKTKLGKAILQHTMFRLLQ